MADAGNPFQSYRCDIPVSESTTYGEAHLTSYVRGRMGQELSKRRICAESSVFRASIPTFSMIFHDLLTPLIISRRRETLYHRATRHSITAARHTLSPRHDTLYHRGTRHSITAARDNLSRRHERLYHGGTRDCITAARDTVSRRQERFYHGGKRDSITITAARDTLSRR